MSKTTKFFISSALASSVFQNVVLISHVNWDRFSIPCLVACCVVISMLFGYIMLLMDRKLDSAPAPVTEKATTEKAGINKIK